MTKEGKITKLTQEIEELERGIEQIEKALAERIELVYQLKQEPDAEFPDTQERIQALFQKTQFGNLENFSANPKPIQIGDINIELVRDESSYFEEGTYSLKIVLKVSQGDRSEFWMAEGWDSSYGGKDFNKYYKVEPYEETVIKYKKWKQ